MVIAISNYKLTDSIDGYASETIELAFGVSVTSKLFRKYSIRVEYLQLKTNFNWGIVIKS
jgi:hypothetical protein